MERKPQVKKALFIGLGGTGAKSLIALKQRFYEVYGHVDEENNTLPEFVKFMVFDTDAQGTKNESKRTAVNATSGKIHSVEFKPSEVIPMQAPDCGEFIMSPQNMEQFTWIPMENRKVLGALNDLNKGAGQVRLFGRIAHFFNYADVRNALSNAINDVRLASHGNRFFEPLGVDPIEVHIVASLGGGTGSGMFMDVGLLVRELLDNQDVEAKINGYFVLPDIFWREASPLDMKRVKPNSIAAMRELDFFMEFLDPGQIKAQRAKGTEDEMTDVWNPGKSKLHESDDPNSHSISVSYIGGDQMQLTSKAYSNVYFIDSENRDGGTFDKVEDLANTVAKGLFAAVSSVSIGLESVEDNNKDGLFRYNNKLGWVGSIGVSELVYNQPEVIRHLSLRLIGKGLSNVLAQSESMATVALQVVSEAGLSEIGDRSDLVTSIRNSAVLPTMELYEDVEPNVRRTEADNAILKAAEVLKSEANSILEKAKTQLDYIDQKLPANGVASARLSCLDEVEKLLISFKEEVHADQEKLRIRIKDEEQVLFAGADNTEMRLKELQSAGIVTRMLKKREIQDETSAWNEGMMKLMESKLMDHSMSHAKDILSALCNEVRTRFDIAKAESVKFDRLMKMAIQEVTTRTQDKLTVEKASPFLLQLHGRDMEESFDLVNMTGWNAKEFAKGIAGILEAKPDGEWLEAACVLVENGGYELLDKYKNRSSKEALGQILNGKIDDAKGKDPQYSEIGQLLGKLMQMSSPMVKIDFRDFASEDGKRLVDCMRKSYVVCVPSESVKDGIEDMIEQLKPPGLVDVKVQVTPDQADRVTVYQRYTGAPVCALAGFYTDHQDYLKRHSEWDVDGEIFHVNYNWFRAMNDIDHSLTEGTSTSSKRMLESWTKALLLGLIQWDDADDVWRIQSGNGTAPSVVRENNRDELFDLLMIQHKHGKVIEEQLRAKFEIDPRAVANALAERMERTSFGDVVFKDKPNDDKNGKMYFGESSINPYVASRTQTDIYGEGAYKRVGQIDSFELLKSEEKALVDLFNSEWPKR